MSENSGKLAKVFCVGKLLERNDRMEYKMGDYEVAVIGAGHAGIEAALAAARLGAKTAIFTMSLDAIGNMPCNPFCRAECSIGEKVRRFTA